MEENDLLAVTPEPFRYESLRGFLLRVSEENGYASPSVIAKLLGVKETALKSKNLPARSLAILLGKNPNILDRHSYLSSDSQSSLSLKILEHKLEPNYAQLLIRSNAQFCPACVKERGYIDAFWDLGIALACPIHNIKPLSHCHKCYRKISWFRPGLLKCDCGADYSRSLLEKCEPKYTELLQIIYAKLHDEPIMELPNKGQFPLSHFNNLTLGQLLSILYKFGRLNKFYEFEVDAESQEASKSTFAIRALKASLSIFSEWPNAYIKFLKLYFNDVDKLGRKYLQSTQYKKLMDELTVNDSTNPNNDFLIDELLLFSSTELKFPKPSFTPKTTNIRGRINIYNFFKCLEDAPLEEWYLHGTKTPIDPEKAAEYVGLPINVLELFWSSGVMTSYMTSQTYKSMKFPWFKEIMDEILQTIKIRNIPGYRRSSVRNERYMILEEFLAKKTVRDETKVLLLDDIFHERIGVYGRVGKKLSDLLLRKSEIRKFVSQKIKAFELEHLSIYDASQYLGTDEYGVEFLIRLGYLHYIAVNKEKRIPSAYLDPCEKQLISIKKIAKNYDQSIEKILDVSKELNIRTISLPGAKDIDNSVFLPYVFEEKIKEYFKSSVN